MLAVCPIRNVYSISEIFGSCINSIFCGSCECQYTFTESSRSIEMMVTKDGSNVDNFGQTDTASSVVCTCRLKECAKSVFVIKLT